MHTTFLNVSERRTSPARASPGGEKFPQTDSNPELLLVQLTHRKKQRRYHARGKSFYMFCEVNDKRRRTAKCETAPRSDSFNHEIHESHETHWPQKSTKS